VGAVVGRTWATATAPASFQVGSHKTRSDSDKSANSDQSSTTEVKCSKSAAERSVRSFTKRAGIGTTPEGSVPKCPRTSLQLPPNPDTAATTR